MQRVSAISIEVVNNLALPCYSYLRQLMTFLHSMASCENIRFNGVLCYISSPPRHFSSHCLREHYEKTLHLLQLWRHKDGQREATWWRLVCCLERLQDMQILEDVKRYLTEKEERTKCQVTGRFGY